VQTRYQQHREFREALKEGKRRPNEEVEAALFKRALGYDTQEVVVANVKRLMPELFDGKQRAGKN
jgi:hypothetical protein